MQNSWFETKLNDERDNFNFNIIRMVNKLNSVSHEMFYSAMSAEISQTYKATIKFEAFVKFTKIFIGRIRKEGGLVNHVKKPLLKLLKYFKQAIINLYFLTYIQL